MSPSEFLLSSAAKIADLVAASGSFRGLAHVVEEIWKADLRGAGLAFMVLVGVGPYGAPAAGGGEVLLTSADVVKNPSGGMAAANTYCLTFCAHFKKGDVPAGFWPKWKVAGGGAEVPYAYWAKRTFADGSLAMMGVAPRMPVAVNSGATQALERYKSSNAPTASSRAVGDGASTATVEVEVEDIDGTTGVLTANLEYAIANGTVREVPNSGGQGKYHEIIAPFRTTAPADDPHLIGWHEKITLENHSGGLYGFLHACRAMQPYIDVTTNRRARGFINCQKTWNGGSRAIGNGGTSRTVSSVASNTVTLSGAHGLDGFQHHVWQGADLPDPLAQNTLYVVRNQTSTAFQVSTDLGAAIITLNDAGSGTRTMVPAIGLSHQSSFFDCDVDGEMDFYAGGGTGAEPVCFFREDPVYLAATRLVPPIPTGVCNTTSPTFSYYPEANATLTRQEGNVGNDISRAIGPMDGYMNRWFDRGDANDRRAVIVRGLCGGNRPIAYYESTTKRVITINNGSDGAGTAYTSLSTPHPDWRHDPRGGNTVNMPANADVGISGDTFVRVDNHTPGVYGWPYHVTGRRCFAHMAMESSIAMVLTRAPGNKSIPGISGTWHCRESNDVSPREIAWGIREADQAYWCRADGDPELPLLEDMLADHAGYAYELTNSTYYNATLRTVGIWSQIIAKNGTSDLHEIQYMVAGYLRAAAAVAGMKPDQPAYVYDLLDFMKVHPKWCQQNTAGFLANNCELWSYARQSAHIGDAAATAAEQIGFADMLGVTWSSADSKFTLKTDTALRWRPVNGMPVRHSSGADMTLPGGVTNRRLYYAVNSDTVANPPTYQLSETVGGSPVTLTNSGNGGLFIQISAAMQIGAGRGVVNGDGSGGDYLHGGIAAVNLCAVDDPTMNDNVAEIAEALAYYTGAEAAFAAGASYWNY